MVEAIVGVALRAVLASVVLGGVLALVVLIATRALALNASARHLLWTTALFAIGLMPLAGIGVSLARGAAPALAQDTRAGGPDARADGTAVSVADHTASRASEAQVSEAQASAAHASAAQVFPAHVAAVPATEHVAAGPSGAGIDRIAFARDAASTWKPRVSRPLAVGAVAVWAIGALAGIVGLIASIVRVRGLKRRSSPLEGTLPDELPWLTETGPGREIYLRLSYETETPVAIGFGRPVILIPTELATADGLSAIEPLILHEHAHLRRYDDWTNLAQRAIERLFWFNPIVWLVGRRIALEREIASDDAVVEKTGEAHLYATSLWKLAREMRMPEHAVVAPGALLTRKQISVRIERLLDANRSRLHASPAAAAGVSLAALLAVGLVATSAPAVELPAPPAMHAQVPAHAAPPHIHLSSRMQMPPHAQVQVLGQIPARTRISGIAQMPPLPRVQRGAAPRERAPLARQDAVVIAGDAGRLVRDAMASIPVQIAEEHQAARNAPRVVAAGVKVTRELIASCTACTLEHADLRGLDLHGLRIEADTLSGADLRNANLAGARLIGVSLDHANLSGADLRGAQLSGVTLEGATFEGARLDGMRMVGVSLHRVNLHGAALRGVLANCTGCDMQGIDLRGQDLHGIVLTGADLSDADLRDANLAGARFTAVDLSNARFDGADLTGAAFVSCDFSGVSLRNAKTTGMTLRGSGLDG